MIHSGSVQLVILLVTALLQNGVSFNPDEILVIWGFERSSTKQHGYPVELHKVRTQDGYILTLHRIPAHGKPPLLIMHGMFGCSADATVQGVDRALGLLAYDAGFDVWMGNNRGTTYSKAHETLDVKSVEFWRYSFHEMGLYDLPAIVDRVLNTTGYRKLQYVAHSQGATQFLVMMSLRPEYNEVFEGAHLSAAVAFLHHSNSPFIALKNRLEEMEAAGRLTGTYEIGGRGPNSYVDAFVFTVHKGFVSPDFILVNLWYMVGYHDSINRTLMLELIKYCPAGVSLYQLLHYGQLYNAKNFQAYDHGPKENLRRYGSSVPTEYPLHKVTAPVYIYYSAFDNLNQPGDVDELARRLPNVRLKYKIPVRRWNHLDFLYGDGAHRIYRMILGEMKQK